MKKSIFILILCIGFFALPKISLAYDPPKGIPDPGWGIDTPTYNPQTHCPNWYLETPRANTFADGGHDCYYIDNEQTSPSLCTDTANDYGYPGHAKCKLPLNGDLSSSGTHIGTYVEVHGGSTPENGYVRNGSVRIRYHGTGTAEYPIIFSGKAAAQKPYIKEYTHLGYDGDVKYFIWENFRMYRIGFQARLLVVGSEIDYLAVRNCEVIGGPTTSASFDVGESAFSLTPKNSNNIIIYNNIFRDGGYSESEPSNFYSTLEDPNMAGVYVSFHVHGIWVVDNQMIGGASDGVAGGHSGEHSSDHYYVGRNIIRKHKENCIDIKSIDKVVISENTCSDLNGSSSGGGAGIIAHYGGISSGPDEVWMIFNKVYSANSGLGVSGPIGKVYAIGNVIYDMTDPYYLYFNQGSREFFAGDTIVGKISGASGVVKEIGLSSGSWLGGDATGQVHLVVDGVTGTFVAGEVLQVVGNDSATLLADANYLPSVSLPTSAYGNATGMSFYGMTELHILENTLYGNKRGIGLPGQSAIPRYIYGNIIAGRTDPNNYNIIIEMPDNVLADYNLFHDPSVGGSKFVWGLGQEKTLETLKNSGVCTNCLEIDPIFLDQENSDFSIGEASDARDANAVHNNAIYDLFFNTYGVDLKKDFVGTSRPQGAGWDIGAYEFVESGIDTIAPQSPSGLTVQ